MDQMSRRLAISCMGAFAYTTSFAEDAESSQPASKPPLTVEPFPVVAFRKDQKERVELPVKRFAERFGIKGNIAQDDSPRCCVWFELVGSANPGTEGWVFVHHGGGSLCYATSEEQLNTAVTALIACADKETNQGKLPIGVSTSFPVNSLA